MRRILLFCGLALFSWSGVAYISKAQEDPGFNFPPHNAPPQARIEFYEKEIQKCKDYLDELSIGINKANILWYARDKSQLFAGYNWIEEIVRFKRQAEITCKRIQLHQNNIRDEMDKVPPAPTPTPTPGPSPGPSTPKTETKSDESSDPLKNKQIRDRDEEIKFINEYRQKVKQVRADADKLFREIEDAAKKANPNPSTSNFKAETTSSGGLSKATFITPQGRILVYLPADMRAGDAISGTVVVEPNGNTPAERLSSLAALNACPVMIGNQMVLVPKTITHQGTIFTILIPTPSELVPWWQEAVGEKNIRKNVMVTLFKSDKSAGRSYSLQDCFPTQWTSVNFDTSQTLAPNDSGLPTTGQQGHPVEITGPFDADLRTTEIRVGGQAVTPLAESPRSCIFKSPDQNVGPTEISVKEKNVETKGTYRNIGVRLSAPKTDLMKGEKTTVTIEVSGLEGIKDDVPLQLESKGVINMEGGNFQNLLIHPKDVQPGGRFTTTRGITGLTAGGFGVTATVIVDRYDMCVAGFGGVLQWLSFTGEYRFRRRGGAPAGGTQTGGTQTGGEKPADEEKPTGTGEITGTGKMVMKGCIITLTHNAPDRRVFATLDACNKTGNAEVQVNPDKTKVEITDSNTADNTCGSKK